MEEMVPKDSLFRKIDKYIDFTFIYDEVKDLYCESNGSPGYRYFLGIPFEEDTPYFSTFSKNYERRFKDCDIFKNIVNKFKIIFNF